MKFDIIGDVHGQYYKLVGLLRHLGYELYQDSWKHPGRTAIFVGDLIDRGPDRGRTVELVRRMEAIGAARCIIGCSRFADRIRGAAARNLVQGQGRQSASRGSCALVAG